MAGASSDQEPTRRDFLFVATAATGAVLTGSAIWPFVNQMNPDASVRALSSINVDVSGVEEGQQITVMWRGKPVFIRRRTADEVDAARAVPLGDLPDNDARSANVPGGAEGSDENRSFGENGEWIVMVGVCTHLGCVPIGDGAGDFGGWFCPCHASHYDSSGRVRKGPAPQNLPIPEIAIDGDTISILEEYRA